MLSPVLSDTFILLSSSSAPMHAWVRACARARTCMRECVRACAHACVRCLRALLACVRTCDDDDDDEIILGIIALVAVKRTNDDRHIRSHTLETMSLSCFRFFRRSFFSASMVVRLRSRFATSIRDVRKRTPNR